MTSARTAVLALLGAGLTVSATLAAVPPVAADEPGVRVAALVRTGEGGLEVQTRRAGSLGQGRALADAWEDERGVVVADVEHGVHATAVDPLRAEQWGLDRLAAEPTWTRTTGRGVVVAVIDTGVQSDHPDLAGQVLPVIDVLDPTATGGPATDLNGHGTHVAGVVAALSGNGTGGSGLAPDARVLPVRVLAADGSGRDSDVAAGVLKAVDAHADVLNLSLGGTTRSPVLSSAIGYAVAHGVVVVAAAGNDGAGTNPVEYPAAEPGVLGVGAVDVHDVLAPFSSTGSYVDLVAPGVQVLSTLKGSGYGWGSGTSMAAPFVSASAALLLAAGVPRTEVADRLVASAQDLGAPGRDPSYGAGMVDVRDALPAAAATAPAAATTVPPAVPVVAAPLTADVPAVVPAPSTVPTITPVVVDPVPAAPVPAPSVRLGVSARAVAAGQSVSVTAGVLGGGEPSAGATLSLERQAGGEWTSVRTGHADRSGLLTWSLRPDVGASYRAVSAGSVSAAVRVDVVQRITAKAARSGATGTVAPGGVSVVVLQRRAGSGWAQVARGTTRADGSFLLPARLGPGTVVRVVVQARPGLLGTATVAAALR